MSKLLQALCAGPADQVVFRSAADSDVAFGAIRAAARRVAGALPEAEAEAPLYAYTRSAAAMCVAVLVAALKARPLVLLPQAGRGYRADLGVADADFLTDSEGEGVNCAVHAATDPAATADPAALTGLQAPAALGFFTSGSSGKPKQITKPLEALEAEASVWAQRFGGVATHVVGSVSHQHIYGLIFRILTPLIAGVTADDEMALSWEAVMTQVDDATLIVSSPAHLARLPTQATVEHKRPAVILSSGGPLAAEAAFAARDLFGVIPLEILGSTETGGVAWRQRTRADEPWTPIVGVEVLAGDGGELVVASAYTGLDAPAPMGDRVRFLDDGRFELLGRMDRILKVEGKRVSLARVETLLKDSAWVDDVAVLSTLHGERDRLSALVTLHEGGKLKLAELGAFQFARLLKLEMADRAEKAETPKRWRFVPQIPVNPQGKRVAADLAALFEAERMMEILRPDRVDVSGEQAEIQFVSRNELPWFEGHFPDTPILPGVAQTHIAARLAEEIWAARPTSYAVNRMKFRSVIQPGEVIMLKLSFALEKGRLTFSFLRDGETLSGGVIG